MRWKNLDEIRYWPSVNHSQSLRGWEKGGLTEDEHANPTKYTPKKQPESISPNLHKNKHESDCREQFDDSENAGQEERGGDGCESRRDEDYRCVFFLHISNLLCF